MNRLLTNKKYVIPFAIICLCVYRTSNAVTLTYNLKVRRTFSVTPIEPIQSRLLLSVVPIFFSRKSHLVDTRTSLDTHEKRRAGGALLNLRYIPSKRWWLEGTTGIETDHATFTGSDSFHASRIGIDDIVLAGGYRHFIGKNGQIIGYGLVGIPARQTLCLEDRYGPLVGTRLYAVGVGAEGSYSFVSELQHSCAGILQARIIHGFNRSWDPILDQGSKLQPGNITDLLVALQARERKIIVEAGYNATIYTHQALILPTTTVKTKTFVRHSGYASLSHATLQGIFAKPCIVGLGCNINYSKKFNAKTITLWVYGSILF